MGRPSKSAGGDDYIVPPDSALSLEFCLAHVPDLRDRRLLLVRPHMIGGPTLNCVMIHPN